MKYRKIYGISLLLGLFSASVLATETPSNLAEPAPITAPTQMEEMSKVQAVEQENKTATLRNVVNINVASASEIQDKLIGIGAKKAQAIVAYREQHGKFLSAEQITEVRGIGAATLEKNRDRIVLE